MNDVDVVVTGATGNIGKELVKLLLAERKKVRAIGRNPEKLKALAKIGADVFQGSLDDAAAMTTAFSGATAAFVMIPPNYTASDFRAYQNKVSEALATAVRKSKVKYVVHLSSMGSHLGEKTGPINGIFDSEARFNKIPDVNVVYLKPVFFMENHLANIGLMKSQGINGSPARPDLKIPMIATRDVAAAAAALLLDPRFTGKKTQELLGAADYTMEEATRIFGKAIGKPDLKYVQFPYADAEKSLAGMGISPDVARLFVEMYRGMNDGLIKPQEPRTKTNSTPTRLEDFAPGFAQIYKAS